MRHGEGQDFVASWRGQGIAWYCRLWNVFWSKQTAASELKEQKETNRELLESAQLLGQAALEAESQVGQADGDDLRSMDSYEQLGDFGIHMLTC